MHMGSKSVTSICSIQLAVYDMSQQIHNKSTYGSSNLKKNVGQCPTWWPPCRI